MSTTTTTTTTPPLPTPPFIPIPGLPNFRDAGGYPLAADPARKMVRRGVLFRSSEPSMLTPAGVAALRDGLGVRTVYDLRSRVEIDRDAGAAGGGGRRVREWDGSERVFAPVFSHEDYSPEAIARRFSAFAREGSEVSGFFFFSLPCFRFPLIFFTSGAWWTCAESGRGREAQARKCGFGWRRCVRLNLSSEAVCNTNWWC